MQLLLAQVQQYKNAEQGHFILMTAPCQPDKNVGEMRSSHIFRANATVFQWSSSSD